MKWKTRKVPRNFYRQTHTTLQWHRSFNRCPFLEIKSLSVLFRLEGGAVTADEDFALAKDAHFLPQTQFYTGFRWSMVSQRVHPPFLKDPDTEVCPPKTFVRKCVKYSTHTQVRWEKKNSYLLSLKFGTEGDQWQDGRRLQRRCAQSLPQGGDKLVSSESENQ